jgi:hypothetical protein
MSRGFNRGQEIAEKPYVFVPIPGDVQRAQAYGHHVSARDLLTGVLHLELVVKRPTQVGSGITDFIPGQGNQREVLALLNASVERYQLNQKSNNVAQTIYVLPGSSLKGVVRSVVEAITPSCLAVISSRTRRHVPRAMEKCRDANKLCPACRLFGMSSAGREDNHQSQLSFTDATSEGQCVELREAPVLWTPARASGKSGGLPSRYLRGSYVMGRKFYYHGSPATGPDARQVIKQDTVLRSKIYFTNLQTSQMGILLTALGKHPKFPFWLKVGAGKPVGLGSIEVRIIQIDLSERINTSGRLGSALKTYQPNDIAWQELMQSFFDKLDGVLHHLGVQALCNVWSEGNSNRNMPNGPY